MRFTKDGDLCGYADADRVQTGHSGGHFNLCGRYARAAAKRSHRACRRAKSKGIRPSIYVRSGDRQGPLQHRVQNLFGHFEAGGKAMMEQLSSEEAVNRDGRKVTQESFNSIYMMADSGARGSAVQIRQLAGM